MDRGYRYFVFDEDGTLVHMPQRVAGGLIGYSDRLPQYAGQSLRVAFVSLHLVDSKPVRIDYVSGSFWEFDAEGSLVMGIDRSADRLPNLEAYRPDPTDKVVDIRARLAERFPDGRHGWDPTPAQITKIVHAIWPETAGRPVKRPKTITGTKKPRFRMTFEATVAENRCREAIYNIARELDDIDDKGLAALIKKIRRSQETEVDTAQRLIWEGVLGAAEHEREVRKARKSEKGTWYASVERIDWNIGERNVGRGELLEEVVCDGRAAAVSTARELLRKHADQFDQGVEVHVDVIPEIEWTPRTDPDGDDDG